MLHRRSCRFYSLQPGRHCRSLLRPPLTSFTQTSFYSLQTGRRFQTMMRKSVMDGSGLLEGFYSLQTGRRFQTFLLAPSITSRSNCFYSLQTGRRFQTGLLAWWQRNALVVSFYSLQPGRRFQTPMLLNPSVRSSQKPRSKRDSNRAFFRAQILPKKARTLVRSSLLMIP